MSMVTATCSRHCSPALFAFQRRQCCDHRQVSLLTYLNSCSGHRMYCSLFCVGSLVSTLAVVTWAGEQIITLNLLCSVSNDQGRRMRRESMVIPTLVRRRHASFLPSTLRHVCNLTKMFGNRVPIFVYKWTPKLVRSSTAEIAAASTTMMYLVGHGSSLTLPAVRVADVTGMVEHSSGCCCSCTLSNCSIVCISLPGARQIVQHGSVDNSSPMLPATVAPEDSMVPSSKARQM